MTAPLRKPRSQPQGPLVHRVIEPTDFIGADREHAVTLFSLLATAELDIGDERQVIKFLVDNRCSVREAFDLAEDVAAAIREIRQREIAA